MSYIDWAHLESISVEEFESTKPYPFANRKGLLTDEGFQSLLANMPELSVFDHRFGEERLAGQDPHDRYSLEYTPETNIPVPWKEFIDELCSDRYRQNIQRLLRAPKIEFRFHWHYTPSGCSVSPHTDSAREHGSHLFYFNSEDDWDPSWGGETLALDDGGKSLGRGLRIPAAGVATDQAHSLGQRRQPQRIALGRHLERQPELDGDQGYSVNERKGRQIGRRPEVVRNLV